ncbi:hypothetical protein ACFVFI_32245 [Streptomyces sp. NPDC057705]
MNVDDEGETPGFSFIKQRTGRCLFPDPATRSDKAGKVAQAAWPTR